MFCPVEFPVAVWSTLTEVDVVVCSPIHKPIKTDWLGVTVTVGLTPPFELVKYQIEISRVVLCWP